MQRPQPELEGVQRSRPQGRARVGREAAGDGEEGAWDPARSMETTAVFPNADVRGFVRIDRSVDVESVLCSVSCVFSLFHQKDNKLP